MDKNRSFKPLFRRRWMIAGYECAKAHLVEEESSARMIVHWHKGGDASNGAPLLGYPIESQDLPSRRMASHFSRMARHFSRMTSHFIGIVCLRRNMKRPNTQCENMACPRQGAGIAPRTRGVDDSDRNRFAVRREDIRQKLFASPDLTGLKGPFTDVDRLLLRDGVGD